MQVVMPVPGSSHLAPQPHKVRIVFEASCHLWLHLLKLSHLEFMAKKNAQCL
jgi:hypothetical protein